MPGKFLALLLLISGGGITLYVVYKIWLGLLQPIVQRKIEQEMTKEKRLQLQNNLQLHRQQSQNPVNITQEEEKD